MRIEIFKDLTLLNEAVDAVKKVLGSAGQIGIYTNLISSPPPVTSGKKSNKSYFVVPVSFGLFDDQYLIDTKWHMNPEKVHRAVNRIWGGYLKLILAERTKNSVPVFFQMGDRVETYPCLRSGIVFKHSARLQHPRELGVSYCTNVKQPPKRHSPISRAKLLMSFQGSSWGMKVRQDLVKVLPGIKWTGHEGWIAYTDCYTVSPDVKKDYDDLLEKSIFVLCPRGVGLSSVRFFEAMAHGRIPILISDHLRLPLDKSIPYSKFVVRVPENDIKNTVRYVQNFIKKNEVNEASKLAHQMFWRIANLDTAGFLQKSLETLP